MRGSLLPLAGCQTFTSAPPPSGNLPTSNPQNTHQHSTLLPLSRTEVTGLIISSINYKGQSKHLCRVGFFFFLLNIFFPLAWKILFTHLYFICFLFKSQSRFEFYNNTELAFKICCLRKENFKN